MKTAAGRVTHLLLSTPKGRQKRSRNNNSLVCTKGELARLVLHPRRITERIGRHLVKTRESFPNIRSGGRFDTFLPDAHAWANLMEGCL